MTDINNKRKQQNKVIMFLYVIFILEYILSIPKCLTDIYQVPSYVMTYKDVGFINRGLIGTISRILFGDIISNFDIILMSMAAMFLILLLISYFVSCLYMEYKETIYSDMLIILFLVYWIMPVGWHAYYQGEFMVHLEVYVVLLNLIIYIAFWKIKTINIKMLVYALVSFIALLIHTNYMFMGFPFILFYLVVDYFKQENHKKYLVKAAILICFVCVLFLFVQFSASICMSFEETTEYVKMHYKGYELDSVLTGEEWGYRPWYHLMLYNYYYSDFFSCLMENLQIYYKDMIIGGIETIIIVSPIIYFFIRTNKKIRISESKELKVVSIASMVFLICFLPLFALTVDYGRWFALLFMYLAITYFTIMYKYKDELEECGYLSWVKCFLDKNKIHIIGIMIIYYAIGKIGLIVLWPRINEVFAELWSKINAICINLL